MRRLLGAVAAVLVLIAAIVALGIAVVLWAAPGASNPNPDPQMTDCRTAYGTCTER